MSRKNHPTTQIEIYLPVASDQQLRDFASEHSRPITAVAAWLVTQALNRGLHKTQLLNDVPPRAWCNNFRKKPS